MSDNLFFDRRELKSCGKNVIIGKTVRIRYPELVAIGDNVIIDDFTYISTSLDIANRVHISAGCKIIGGRDAFVKMDEFSTLAPNVVLAAGSDDYISGLATPGVPRKFKGAVQIGKIHIARHSIVGANTTVLPDVEFGEGASVGAQSLVKTNLKAWWLYAGVPAKAIKERNQAGILQLEKEYLMECRDD